MSYGVALRNGVPFTLGTIAALCTNATGSAWSPLALWPDGIDTPGLWISPRDLTSEWADYTGTTPVSVPGTVADSSNPVGLALDIRAGAPEVLGPELVVNGDFSDGSTGWVLTAAFTVSDGKLVGDDSAGNRAHQDNVTTAGKWYQVSFDYASISGIQLRLCNTADVALVVFAVATGTSGTHSAKFLATGTTLHIEADLAGFVGTLDNISVKEVPGNHMLQAASTARPLVSAYDGQPLGPGDTYDGTGYPIAQLYDGVDDGMATAAFSAGTLIDGMDCMIAVRRDAGTIAVAGLNNQPQNVFFGIYVQGGNTDPTHQGCGTPVPYVDGVELTGGTSGTRNTLYNALTAGEWHILEYRNLDLSTWTKADWGNFGAIFFFNGARGDILLYPSTTPTEDKDAARQWLADYYGVTLP
jgi:hypothetical protein